MYPIYFPMWYGLFVKISIGPVFFLGTHGSGLCYYDMREMTFQTVDLSFRSVWTLYTDSITPFLYVGTWGEGLRLYDMETRKYMSVFPSEIEHERIYSISPL